MTTPDYNQQHLGYVVCPSGISEQAWAAFAATNPKLTKQPSVKGINPFTHQPMLYDSNSYLVVDGDKTVGVVAWEETECIGVAGVSVELAPFISLLCKTFSATFKHHES
jgi:hypothetical protein